MKEKFRIVYCMVLLPAIIAAAGCAGYGSLEFAPYAEQRTSIESLITRQDQYLVYYAGYAPNNASGLLFDPRYDARRLEPSSRWEPIAGEDRVREVADWLEIQTGPGYYPTLHRIRGPEGEFYGYLFSGWDRLVTKQTAENVMFVYDLPDPPHYYGGMENERSPGP